MKTLNNYIIEWKAKYSSADSIKNTCFIYEIDKKRSIKIFESTWPQYNEYKDKVYINGEHAKLNKRGKTENLYEPGTYMVEIKDIDELTSCKWMFWVTDIKKVPLLDSNNITNTEHMFYRCDQLEEVPLFDTKYIESMDDMFFGCKNLSDETKKEWSQIYDFTTDKRK